MFNLGWMCSELGQKSLTANQMDDIINSTRLTETICKFRTCLALLFYNACTPLWLQKRVTSKTLHFWTIPLEWQHKKCLWISEFSPALATNCRTGSSMCHTSATCEQYSEGFCCICQTGWFGNGETCLPNGFPQRIRGKVNGVINSIRIEDQDLHCYIVTDDGRTYTAISK